MFRLSLALLCAVLAVNLLSSKTALADQASSAPLKGSVWETTSELAERPGHRTGSAQRTARSTEKLVSAERSAALQALHIALNRVPDGRTFVWNADPLAVQGRITPTHSFRDQRGRVCRHLRVDLARAANPVRTHTVACRQRGRWHLEG